MADCPKCPSTPLLERTDGGGVAYDVCPICHGLWLDSGELYSLLAPEGVLAPEGPLMDPKPSAILCPRCGGLVENGGYVNPVLRVDRCLQCRGLWLDGSEMRVLRKLLGLAGELETDKAPGPAPVEEPQPPQEPPAEVTPPESRPLRVESSGGGLMSAAAGTPAWLVQGLVFLAAGAVSLGLAAVRYFRWREAFEAGADGPQAPVGALVSGMALIAFGVAVLVVRHPMALSRRRSYRGRWWDDRDLGPY